jgi:hypothetical protein
VKCGHQVFLVVDLKEQCALDVTSEVFDNRAFLKHACGVLWISCVGFSVTELSLSLRFLGFE